MCTVEAGLLGVGSYLQMSADRRRQNAQRVAEDRQLKLQEEENLMNAKLKQQQAEQLAQNYAKKEKQMKDKYKLLQASNIANSGASGISSTTGSAWDLAEASREQFVRNNYDLLSNQRNDMFGLSVEEYNLRNRANHIGNIRNYRRKAYQRSVYEGGLQSLLSLSTAVGGNLAKYKKVPQKRGMSFGVQNHYNAFASSSLMRDQFGFNDYANYLHPSYSEHYRATGKLGRKLSR